MFMLRSKMFIFLSVLFIIAISYVLKLASFYCADVLNWPFSLFLLLIISLALFAVGLNYVLDKFNPATLIFLVIIGGVSVLLRASWMMNVDTALFSDFTGYFHYASEIAKGYPRTDQALYNIFPFTVGYPVVISFWYKIFGATLVAGKVFNLLCSVIVLLLIYFAAEIAFDRSVARICALIFALWPTQVMYSSVMATEHIFGVFYMLSILLVFLIGNSLFGKKVYMHSFTLGMALTATQFIRPISILLFPAIFLYIYIFSGHEISFRNLAQKTRIFAIICITYMLTLFLLTEVVFHFTGVNLSNSSPGYNLLMGTNAKYRGVWNPEDAEIIKEFGYDANRIQEEALSRSLSRIRSNPGGFLKFALTKKIAAMWENEGYGYYWSTQRINSSSAFFEFMNEHSKFIRSIYQSYYVLILFLVLVGSIFALKNINYNASLLMLLPLGVMGAHLFLEVQGRYAFPAMTLLIIMSAYGVTGAKEFVCNKYPKKSVSGDGISSREIPI